MISTKAIEKYVYGYLNRYSHPGYTLKATCVDDRSVMSYYNSYNIEFSTLPYKWYHYSPLGLLKMISDTILVAKYDIKYHYQRTCGGGISIYPPMIKIALIPDTPYTARCISPTVKVGSGDSPQFIEYETVENYPICKTIRENAQLRLLKKIEHEEVVDDKIRIVTHNTTHIIDYKKLEEQLGEFEDWYNKNIYQNVRHSRE